MLHRHANDNNALNDLINHAGRVDVRKELNERQPEMKKEVIVEQDRSWAQNKIASNNYGDTLARNAASVRSSRCADSGITNFGGPKKQPKMASANSIWNSENIANLAKNLSNKEATQLEKESSSRLRQLKQTEYKQSLTPTIGNEDIIQNKGATISAATAKAGGKGWVPTNKISMFDNSDKFERLDALQNRVNPKVAKQETKVANTNASKLKKSAKQVTDMMIESYVDENKETNYKSIHTSAVDRLFDALNNQKDK